MPLLRQMVQVYRVILQLGLVSGGGGRRGRLHKGVGSRLGDFGHIGLGRLVDVEIWGGAQAGWFNKNAVQSGGMVVGGRSGRGIRRRQSGTVVFGEERAVGWRVGLVEG